MKIYCLNKSFRDSKKANSIARFENAKGFANSPNVEEVIFFTISNKFKKKKPRYNKIENRELYFPFYSDSNHIIFQIYKYFFADVLIGIFYFFYALFFTTKKDIIYVRDANSLYLILLTKMKKINYVYENHNFEFGHNKILDILVFRLMKNSTLLVTVSKYTASLWKKHGVKKRILIYPSGVDWDFFSNEKKAFDFHKKLKINKFSKIILYSGHLYSWKGTDTLLQSAESIQNNDNIHFVFLGGDEKSISKYLQKYGHIRTIHFLGHVPHNLVPSYLHGADILVLPNTSKERISYYHTSPIKLLEYLAIGKPILSSKLPSIQSLVSNDVIYFNPDDNADLSKKLIQITRKYPLYLKKSKEKSIKYAKYSWDRRAETIIKKFKRTYYDKKNFNC